MTVKTKKVTKPTNNTNKESKTMTKAKTTKVDRLEGLRGRSDSEIKTDEGLLSLVLKNDRARLENAIIREDIKRAKLENMKLCASVGVEYYD